MSLAPSSYIKPCMSVPKIGSKSKDICHEGCPIRGPADVTSCNPPLNEHNTRVARPDGCNPLQGEREGDVDSERDIKAPFEDEGKLEGKDEDEENVRRDEYGDDDSDTEAGKDGDKEDQVE